MWFPGRESPAIYERLVHECFRGGLKSPRVLQAETRRQILKTIGRTSPVAEINQNIGRLQILVNHLPLVQPAAPLRGKNRGTSIGTALSGPIGLALIPKVLLARPGTAAARPSPGLQPDSVDAGRTGSTVRRLPACPLL